MMKVKVTYVAPSVPISEIQERLLEEIGKELVKNIRKNTPVISGKLQKSITYKINKKERKVNVYTNVGYGKYVEYGTGIHAEDYTKDKKGNIVRAPHSDWYIVPKKADALHWKDKKGRDHFAQRVHQVGFEGKHMFKQGLVETIPKIKDLAKIAFRKLPNVKR